MRDTARWFDACNGYDEYDPYSLPRVSGWEAGLGHQDVRGMRAVVCADLGAAVVASAVREKVEAGGRRSLIKDAELNRVDVPVSLARGGLEWAIAGTAACSSDSGTAIRTARTSFTPEIMLAANIATNHFGIETAKNIEAFRRTMIVQMAEIFEQADFIICATNPDVAFGAQGPMPTTVDGVDLVSELGFEAALGNNGALTIPANTTGHPAVAIPDRHGRRTAGLHAGDRAAPRRAALARAGPGGRARASVAARGSRRASLTRGCHHRRAARPAQRRPQLRFHPT